MADSYVKLWASITESSVWSLPADLRVVWVTMLTMADEHGYVGASIDGIARRSNVPVEVAEEAIRCFEAPDPRSRSEVEEGRRIRRVDRGWHIINHGYFKNLRDKEARREYERQRKAERRARDRKSQNVPSAQGHVPDNLGHVPDKSGIVPMSAHADASAVSERVSEELRSDGRGSSGTVPEGRDDDPPGSLDLKEALLGRGILVLSPAKLRAVLWRLHEVNWQPEDLDRLAETVGGKTAKQRHARMAALLCDEERFNALNNEWCRQASEGRR